MAIVLYVSQHNKVSPACSDMVRVIMYRFGPINIHYNYDKRLWQKCMCKPTFFRMKVSIIPSFLSI